MPELLIHDLPPERESEDRRITWSRVYDGYRQAVFSEPSPTRMKTLLTSIDQGEYHLLPEMAMEIERRDGQIRAMAMTRRTAINALDWEVIPNAEQPDDSLAEEAAQYCHEHLAKLPTFRKTLKHLAFGFTWGISGAELIWNNSELVETVDIPCTRWTSPMLQGTPGVHVITDNYPMGIEAPWGKFAIFMPDETSPYPLGVTLVHVAAKLYGIKHFMVSSWNQFLDLYAIPARGFEAPESVSITGTNRTEAETMLKRRGMDFWWIADNGMKLVTEQADRSTNHFTESVKYVDDAIAKLYLGQTLSSDIGEVGSRAAATEHNAVRGDILAGDLAAESDNIEMNFLKPMCMMKFSGRDVPIPQFRRRIKEAKDIEADRMRLEQLRFASERGLHIDDNVLYEELNIPIPLTEKKDSKTDQDVAVTVNELTLGIERATRAGNLSLVNALTAKVAELLGVPVQPLAELPAARDSFGRTINKNGDENSPDGDEDDQDDNQDDDESRPLRERVLSTIHGRYLNSKQIMMVLKNVSIIQVKGVLNASDLKTKIQIRKRRGKLTDYRYIPN